MNYLTKEMNAVILNQIALKGRDIDCLMINAMNDELPKEMLLDCLTLYLNKDGGYGHGLHIDNYNPNSSVYQCYEAFRLLRMLDIDYKVDSEIYDMVIIKPLNYLFNRCELKENKWNPNVLTNNDFAHDEPFSYNEENRLLLGYHPTAALIGFTLVLCDPKRVYYKKAMKQAEALINDFYKKESFTAYELKSFNSLLESIKRATLFIDEQPKIEERLISLCEAYLKMHEEERALDIADAVNSEYIDSKKEAELDEIINNIAIHGLWDHKKEWVNKNYPEADSANLKWIGLESVNNYYLLKKYGRIA